MKSRRLVLAVAATLVAVAACGPALVREPVASPAAIGAAPTLARGGYPVVVSEVTQAALFPDEDARVRAAVASWLSASTPLSVVPAARVEQIRARAVAGENLDTGEACGAATHAHSGYDRVLGEYDEADVRNERSLAGRYLVVRYEDLVGDPEREMERVRAFLEVSPHPSLTTPTVAGVPVRANSSFDAGAPGVISRAHDAREVSRFEGRLLGAFTASSARAFGYELPAPSLVPRAALRLWGEIAHASRVARERVANGVWRSDGD